MRNLIAPLSLAWPLAKRDIMARYRGTLAGVVWALLGPLAMLLIYTAVFSGVFQARWGSVGDGGVAYVMRLFAGLIVFNAVAEVATRATRLMLDNANLVKRVVFPLELLAVAQLMQVAVHTALQIGLLATMVAVWGEGVRWTWLWLPLAWAWAITLQYALALLLAALGCYLRDLQHLVPVATTGLLFLSPVFYPVDSAPTVLRALLAVNPISAPIELFRHAWFGDAIDPMAMTIQGAALVLVLLFARWLFLRLRPGFADLV
jgi:lipopolysaccharide transport system permease protein